MSISINTKKRLIGDLKLLLKEKPDYFEAIPQKDNMLVWYFILKGPKDTVYQEGYYIGKIEHDISYPEKPPNFYMMTPNGRFSINQKICLTISSYHSDQWSPSWTILNIVNAFYSVMIEDQDSGISHIRDTPQARKKMASESVKYNKLNFPDVLARFKRLVDENGDPKN